MALITQSIAGFLSGRLRPHADAPDTVGDMDLAAQVPPEMQRHLRKEGLWSVLMFPFFVIGFFAAAKALGSWVMATPFDFDVGDVVFGLVLGVGLCLLLRPPLWRGPLNREIAYRRRCGKWRWEH